jgi:hypothetical protein
VAGVVSGANGLSAGAILGNLPGHEDAPPIALSGRVWVYCDSCGDDGHTETYTDADGFYSFQDVYAGVFPILVRKDGYSAVNPARVLPSYADEFTARVTGDARLDIQLTRQ